MFCVVRCLFAMLPMFLLAGCHNPARPNVPKVAHEQREAGWRKELAPGRKADFALGYLLTNGFDCQVTRDTRGRVERILATERKPLPDASGAVRKWQIDLSVLEERIQSVEITPVPAR